MELGSGLRPWRRFCAEAVDATETDASVSPPRCCEGQHTEFHMCYTLHTLLGHGS